MPKFIPYAAHSVTADDIEAVVTILKGGHLTQGPTIERFEEDLSKALDVKHSVAVANGTAALHIAALAAGLKPGDAAIVPAITFAATANAVLYTGATPIFADIAADTLGLEPESASAAIALAKKAGLRPRAIFPVHYAGRPVDLDPILALSQQHDLVVIEDACHAIGAEYRLDRNQAFRRIGSKSGHMAAWSFHPAKHVTSGEGGAVTTDDPKLYKSLKLFRSHGITKNSADYLQGDLAIDPKSRGENPWYHEMQELGFNYRLCDIQAALVRSQLSRLNSNIAARRAAADLYRKQLAGLRHVVLPPGDSDLAKHAYHLFPLQIDYAGLGKSRREVMLALQEQSVGTQVHYLPVFWHPFYRRNAALWKAVPCPRAEAFYERALSIPMFHSIDESEVKRVCNTLKLVME